jgi:hypothetical protein
VTLGNAVTSRDHDAPAAENDQDARGDQARTLHSWKLLDALSMRPVTAPSEATDHRSRPVVESTRSVPYCHALTSTSGRRDAGSGVRGPNFEAAAATELFRTPSFLVRDLAIIARLPLDDQSAGAQALCG